MSEALLLDTERFHAATAAAEASWRGQDMSWEAALAAGILAYLAASEVTDATVDRAIGYFTSCESSDMRDMMRAALEGAMVRPATSDFAAGMIAGEEAVYEALNDTAVAADANFLAFCRRHAVRVHLSLGAARNIILGLATRLERVASERDSWRRVSERLEHEKRHNLDITRLG